MNSPAVLFQMEGTSLAYQGREVLRDIRLRVSPGEKVALLGASGAGKSTLLRQLRLQQATQVAWCPQQPGLVPMLSVYHNIYMGRLDVIPWWKNLANLVYPNPVARTAIAAIASQLGIGDQLFTSADRLSGGQQSRVSLGRALYQRRPVFMGDEPVSALDERQADQLLGLMMQQHETAVVALHDVALAMRHCTRIVGLEHGRIQLDCPVSETSEQALLAFYPQ
ncbi:MAG: ATP-binding cassette domain-containing protein [Hahellaceae bacterium]|nr:ATP-binding cassette domain-containing protein [Hahellaceae bacterium]MCP5169773.1 ATP-binding cassette domain-containing protein [Hahellaceae bacterium]